MLKRVPIVFVAWVAGLAGVIGLGLFAAYFVFRRGLIVTGLSDAIPWGLWITIDLSSIALAAGAFTISAGVYILKAEKYKPVARLAVFIGLIGYTMAVLTLMLDIGRPERFWHVLAYGNPHSVLWEVTWCVTLYLAVLLIEVAPIIGEAPIVQRLPFIPAILRKLHHATPVLAVLGLCLSLLHQSSLGATYGVVKARPIWFKTSMAVLFIGSAMAAGLSVTILAALITSFLRRRELIPRQILSDLGGVAGIVLAAYVYLRLWDTLAMTYTYYPLRSEALTLLTRGPFRWGFWGWEILLGGIVPAVVFLHSKLRQNVWALFTACGLVVIGLVINRWNVNLSGLMAPLSISPALSPTEPYYQPTWIEWATGAAVVGYGLLVFTLGTRFLPLFTHPHETARHG